MNYDFLYKILLIGDSSVGKSSIIYKFSDNIFDDKFITTIGVDFKLKDIKINNKTAKLQIWDTAGQERFKTVSSTYYRGSHGIIIVFDLTNKESFNNIKYWINEINKYTINQQPIILVGNKSDLKRCVPIEKINSLSNKYDLPYIETSAKYGDNIDHIFNLISKQISINRIPNLNNYQYKSVLNDDVSIKDINYINYCC